MFSHAHAFPLQAQAHTRAPASTHDRARTCAHTHGGANTLVCRHRRAHSHTSVHTHGHTHTHTHGPAAQHGSSARRRLRRESHQGVRQPPDTSTPRYVPCLSFPSWRRPAPPLPPGPVGAGVAWVERGRLEPRQDQGLAPLPLPRTTRRPSPEIWQPNAAAFSVPQPNQPPPGQLMPRGESSHRPPSFLSLPKQHHGKIQPQLEQAHPEGQGCPQHLPCFMIWDTPA